MVEITEAATRDDHARNGLYTAVSSTLLLEIAGRSRQGSLLNGEIDVIFGECNGNALGVLKTVKTQGRTLAVEVSESLGFPGTGMLEQHVPISGAPSDTPYNDLFPAYLTRERLYELY